jgi:hypothetical protein
MPYLRELDLMKSALPRIGITDVDLQVILTDGTPAERDWLRNNLIEGIVLERCPYLPTKHRGWR